MLHVNVGTANAINNIINLNRDNVLLILAATAPWPPSEGCSPAAGRYIHWGQEMFDQAWLREAVKGLEPQAGDDRRRASRGL